MSNRLLRTVKTRRPVDKLLKGLVNVTIFRKIVYKTVYLPLNQISVSDSHYEVFEGHFKNYKLKIKPNERVEFVGCNKTNQDVKQ